MASPRGQTRGQKSSKSTSYPGRALAALLVLLIIMVVAITGKDTFSPGKWNNDFKVALGLDLAGGTQVTLRATTINGKTPTASDMTTAIAIMNQRVDAQGFNNAQVQQQGSNFITVTVPGKNAQQVVNLVGTTALLFFRQVLLEGAAKSTVSTSASPPTPGTTPSPGSSPSAKASSTPTTKASSSPSPSAEGAPGSPGQSGGQRLSTASRLLAGSKHSGKPKSSSSATPKSSGSPGTSPSPSPTATAPASQVSGNPALVSPDVRKTFNQLNCNDKNWKAQIGYTSKEYDNPDNQIVSCGSAASGTLGTKYVLDKAKISGVEVTGAQAGLPNSQTSLNSNQWQVNMSLNGKGAKAFGDLTAEMYSKYASGSQPTSVLDQLAVVLDGVVVSSPNIDQGAITGGQAQIFGSFTQAQATQLADQLQYGALPIDLKSESVQSVSPQLGRNQLVAGLIAAAIGLGLVIIYSFLYYRGLGLVSVSSLVIASLLAYLTVVLLSKYASSGFNLSLAGIAGLIVAIGITADSFVVFFERLRDEVREGRSLRPAVESGWKRARRTILVSDTVSFLAALLLWYFSVSDVKGFAFTLGLTTLIDVLVVFLFTKPMVTLLARTKFFGNGHPLSGLDPKRLGARTPWRSGIPRTAARSRVKEV